MIKINYVPHSLNVPALFKYRGFKDARIQGIKCYCFVQVLTPNYYLQWYISVFAPGIGIDFGLQNIQGLDDLGACFLGFDDLIHIP